MLSDPTRDDISFLKRVSEEGRYAPLLGGRYLVMWGSVITVAYLFQYLILSQTLAWPGWSIMIMWIVVMLVAGGFMLAFPNTMAKKPGRNAISNQVEQWVWCAAGMGIGSYAIGTILAVSFAGAPIILFDFIVAIALAAYGTAFVVVANISDQRWMKTPAIISFAGASLIPFVAGKPETYLMGAGIVFLAAVVPGIRLLRAEPAALPESV